MSNRAYLSAPHRLLPSGYSGLTSPRSGLTQPPSSRASPPEFPYDAYPRSAASGGGGSSGTRGDSASSFSRPSPSSVTGSSALSMAYPSLSEFPYGLSGVQMPTYNFGSELYNYVSNGFPRKSRMCTYCNKVFTRSTTRRYHERRCPLLRASNSLAKNEENSTAAAVAAMKDQQRERERERDREREQQQQQQLQQQQQRQKESTLSPGAMMSRGQPTGNVSRSSGGSHPSSAPTSSSPPPHSLHPAYPTSFPPSAAALTPNSARSNPYSNYAASYGSFYTSISAAAMASLDQNSNKKDSEPWPSSPSPSSGKLREHPSLPSPATSALLKAYTSDPSNVELTSRYCADFSLRSQPPVFPPNSLRAPPASPPSPEPGETKSDIATGESQSPRDFSRSSSWGSNHARDTKQPSLPDKIPVANISGSRLRANSSPPPVLWNNKMRMERAREQYMAIQNVDDEDDDDDDEEEDEAAVEEDEEQFNMPDEELSPMNGPEGSSLSPLKTGPGRPRGNQYNPLVCQYCKKSFRDPLARKAHEELHPQRKAYACCICPQAFHCAYSLRIHFLRQHRQGPYDCKFCLKPHKEPLGLKAHLITQHSLSKSESYSLKNFSLLDGTSVPSSSMTPTLSDSEREVHEKSRSNQRRSVDNITEALKEKTTKSPTSNEASPLTPNGNVSNEETELCKICNKAFAKSFIRFHERSHADQKPYECPLCHKRFGYKNNMKSHMKLHQGLKPYQCQICGARFTRGSTLRRHGRRHNISRTSMLDYVLYDHTAGPSRAMGVNHKSPSMVPTTSHAAVTAAAAVAAAALNIQYMSHNRLGMVDPAVAKSYLQARTSLTSSSDNERHLSSHNRSPTYSTTPPPAPTSTGSLSSGNLPSPRNLSSHLTNQAMPGPMVGDLAAVAAANLFGYPPGAAQHLYPFYASTNQFMNYPALPSSQANPAVQSDALNLSLGKRKSPLQEIDEPKEKSPKKEFRDDVDASHRKHQAVIENLSPVKPEEPGEVVKYKKEPHNNPFMPAFAIKREHNSIDTQDTEALLKAKEPLKISTEDFGAQVNICCHSPQVQSSTGPAGHPTSGSPVGSSSSCMDAAPHASPSGISHHGSPANSATSIPSPNTAPEPRENQGVPDLLLPLLSSGRMFRCAYCDIYFTEYAMFRVHQKHHQIDTTRPFVCSYCGEDCKEKNFFTLHISAHLKLVTT